MSATGPRRGIWRNERARIRMRQVALFAAILISGGLLSIPRFPLLLVVLIICFALENPLRMFKTEFAAVWILIAATVAVALVGGGSFQIAPMAIRLANFLAGAALLLLYINERPGLIAKDLLPIFRFFGAQAVLTPLLALIAPGLFWTFQIQETTYHTLFYIFTYHEFILDASFFKRADGFFFEPGVFQLYLNIYLFAALFLRRFSAADVGLATFGVLATQSTTGVVILVILYGAAYLRWMKTAERSQKLAVFILGPIVLAPLGAYATYNLGEKFYGQASGSAEAREYDLRTGLRVIREHPLTGIGFDYEKYFDVASRVSYREANMSLDNMNERSNTNGVVSLLYSVGIPLGLIFLLGLWRQRLFRPRGVFAGLGLLTLLSQSLFFTPFVCMIVFSGLLIRPQREPRVGGRRHRSPAKPKRRAQTA